MAGISGSSIQPWLDLELDDYLNFSTTAIPATIPSCQTRQPGDVVLDNCTQVCNSSGTLLDDELPNNLLTCGLWATLVTLDNYNNEITTMQPNVTKAVHKHYQDVLARFTTLGLDAGDEAYVSAAIGAVSTTMFTLLKENRIQTYQADSIQGLCSQQELFPTAAFEFNTDVPQHVRDCVTAICAPRSLNPDLGGIGVKKVFTSLLMQLGIAIIILLGLLWLTVRPLRSQMKNEDHMTNLATALLDFHKAQCYFISAIEIAALVLASEAYGDFKNNESPAVFDILLALPLSLNGIVPVAFSLSCIALYSRLSWHIILLSTVPIALATGALASTYIWILRISDAYGPDMLSVSNAGVAFQYVPNFTVVICGSKSSNLENVPNRRDIRFAIIWLIYTYCIAWALWCLLMQVFKSSREESVSTRVLAGLKILCLGRLESGAKNKLAAYGYAISLVVWGLCFVYHFYLYSLFTRSNLVSGQWSFGQIIAVTVWIPSIVELLYIEHEGIENGSKYRYPPGVQAVKSHHVILESTDNIQLVPQPLLEAGSDEIEAA